MNILWSCIFVVDEKSTFHAFVCWTLPEKDIQFFFTFNSKHGNHHIMTAIFLSK